MSIFYRIIIILLILAAGYSLFGIVHFKWMYHRINNPKAEFLITGNENADTTVVEFISYGCGYCKTLHPTIEEMLEIRKDIRYVARPISFGETNESMAPADRITRIALAAGLQGKFWEMHKAFLEYPEDAIPDDFIEETADLYGIDYEQMMKDSEGKEVKKLLDNNYAAMNHASIFSVPSFVIGNQIYIVQMDKVPDLSQILKMIETAEQK